VDTNSVFLAEELMDIGIETDLQRPSSATTKRTWRKRSARRLEHVEVNVVTGGIGPTEDDITRKAVAKVLKKRLV